MTSTDVTLYAVTVRLEKNPDHNPKRKVSGPCPVTGHPCDDITGEHHTFVASMTIEDSTPEMVRASYEAMYHVTRVEELLTLSPATIIHTPDK